MSILLLNDINNCAHLVILTTFLIRSLPGGRNIVPPGRADHLHRVSHHLPPGGHDPRAGQHLRPPPRAQSFPDGTAVEESNGVWRAITRGEETLVCTHRGL